MEIELVGGISLLSFILGYVISLIILDMQEQKKPPVLQVTIVDNKSARQIVNVDTTHICNLIDMQSGQWKVKLPQNRTLVFRKVD